MTTTARKKLSSGDEVIEKATKKKTTARGLPSRKNKKPSSGKEVRKTVTKKKTITRDDSDTGSAQAHIAKIIATSQKKGWTKRGPMRNA